MTNNVTTALVAGHVQAANKHHRGLRHQQPLSKVTLPRAPCVVEKADFQGTTKIERFQRLVAFLYFLLCGITLVKGLLFLFLFIKETWCGTDYR
jgi:hypothetical protein